MMVRLNLISFFTEFYALFGFDLARQINGTGPQPFLALVLAFTYLDISYTSVSMLVPEQQYDYWLIKLGIINYIFGPTYRTIIYTMSFVFRLLQLLCITIYALDHFAWLQEANCYFERNPFLQIKPSFVRVLHRCRPVVLLNTTSNVCVLILGIISVNLSPSVPYKRTYGYVYIAVYLTWNIFCMQLFAFKFYLLCRLSTDFYRQLYAEHRHNPRLDRPQEIRKVFHQFRQVYRMIHCFKPFLARIYLSYASCIVLMTVQFFYLIFFLHSVNWFMKAGIGVLGASLLAIVAILSMLAGQIRSEAQRTGELLYQKINIKPRFNTRAILVESILFFDGANGGSTSLEVLKTPINVQIVVVLTTLFFTVFAILISTLRLN